MNGPWFWNPPVVTREEAQVAAERELEVFTRTGAGTPTIVHGTFDFGDNLGDEHLIRDRSCEAGWCGSEYPKACEVEGCAGLVHANFGDESYDSYWLYKKCDVCGEPE